MKFLVIQQKMIGDVLTSSILCEALKMRFPESEVHYLINSHTAAVVAHHPFIDQLIYYTPAIEKSSRLQKQLRQELFDHTYDVVIDVYSKLGSARMARATKAKMIIGYKKWYTHTAYTHSYTYNEVAQTEAGLAIENRMKLLQAIDSNFPAAIKPKIYLTAAEIAFAKAQLDQHQLLQKGSLFMIGVLGSSPDKTYPLEQLAHILDALVAETSGQLLFNYIPSQLEQVEALYHYCKAETKKHIHLEIYGKSLREFMALTYHCKALIGNEGGAVNMAKALEVPTFAIFSPWIKKQAWALYENDKNVAVHLADLYPEYYDRPNYKKLKKKVSSYYDQLKSSYVIARLQEFLRVIEQI